MLSWKPAPNCILTMARTAALNTWLLLIANIMVTASSKKNIHLPTVEQTPMGLQDEDRTIHSPLRLDISNHSITTVGEEELPHNVTALISKGNPLRYIADHAFNESTDTLQAIDIEHSLLASLPVAALTEVTSLTSLTINHGPMSSIPAGQVTILPALRYLDLSYNHLTDIANITVFRDAAKLYQVELGNNQITDMSPLYDLQLTLRLNLVNNQLSHIAPPTSNRTTGLANHLLYLWLQGNNFTNIPDLSFMPALQVLELSNNNISNSAQDKFPNSLLLLYMRGNSLRWIPRAVSAISDLRQLHLENNRVSSLDSFVFPSSLRSVSLENNTIKQINSLHFSANKSQLTSLKLSGNPLTLISRSALAGLTRLHSLSLTHTQLTRLPLALLALTHLTSLDLAACPQLTCTCQESVLASWANHVTSLKGDCVGGATVKYFLTTLARQCPAPTAHRPL